MGLSGFFASWVFVFVVVGAFWYVVDKRLGVLVYRWWYAMTHKDPLPDGPPQGFIFNQQAKARFSAALTLCVVQSSLAIFAAHVDPSREIISLFLEVPLLMLGFYFGPWLDRLWQSKDEILDTVDKLESGEISIKGEIEEASEKAMGTLKKALTTNESGPVIEKQSGDKTIASEEAVGSEQINEEPQDSRSLMKKYLRD